MRRSVLLIGISLAFAAPCHANIIISEVAPWGSGNTPYAADWFELTNTGASAVTIANWRMDDNSNSFASSVALLGVTSIAAGQSVVFLETNTPASTIQAFLNTWFGTNVPAGFAIGSYSGSGVGLSTGGDAVNIFEAGGTLRANVAFGASPTGPFPSFDNSAGLNNATISQPNVAGVLGAFSIVNP